MKIAHLACLVFIAFIHVARTQDEGSGSGDASVAAPEEGSGSGDAEAAETGSGTAEVVEETSGQVEPEDEGSGLSAEDEDEEECSEEVDDDQGSGDIASLLSLSNSTKKCKQKGVDELLGSDALEAVLSNGQCDMDGMDEKLAGCLDDLNTRVETMEQAVLSGEGGALEDQITLVLVKKGVIDCSNDTQCDTDKACLDSNRQAGRKLCEPVCDRLDCLVQHSECIGLDHEASCECEEGFHGNGTENCIPDGFTAEDNGKHYKMFDDKYVEWEEAVEQCESLGARLPVLDKAVTITIIKKYLKNSNFSVFEEWDKSSRRIWIGLFFDRGYGLVWADGQRVVSYPASSRMFVWEARRLLSQEVSRADNSRHYGFYIDGDIAKLPGGGRKGAAVLCELLPPGSTASSRPRSRSRSGPNDTSYPGYKYSATSRY